MSQQEGKVVLPSSAHLLTFKVRTPGALEGCTRVGDWEELGPYNQVSVGHYKSAGPVDFRQCDSLETKLSKCRKMSLFDFAEPSSITQSLCVS